jgi:hypothetical protein
MLAWTVISILAPVIALHDRIEMNLDERLAPPSTVWGVTFSPESYTVGASPCPGPRRRDHGNLCS